MLVFVFYVSLQPLCDTRAMYSDTHKVLGKKVVYL